MVLVVVAVFELMFIATLLLLFPFRGDIAGINGGSTSLLFLHDDDTVDD